MRIASLDQIKHLGKSAQKQIMKALNEETVRPITKSKNQKAEDKTKVNLKTKSSNSETESVKKQNLLVAL